LNKHPTLSLPSKLKAQDLSFAGKKVLIRVDYNVPLKKDGTIADDTRIRASLPTLDLVLKGGGAVVLIAHLDNPTSKQDVHLSLGICAKRLAELIPSPVRFATDCVGKDVDKLIQELKGGEVLLLENLRFYPAEKDPNLDPTFAASLAKGLDYYINDAFGSAHRAHSSTTTVTQYFPGRAAMGLHLQEELAHLYPLLTNPKRPFFALVGGAKIAAKLPLLQSLISRIDALFIGGGMALPFLYTPTDETRIVVQLCQEKQIPLYLPQDLVTAKEYDWRGVDIGPQTIASWGEHLKEASTVFWNGPLGITEIPAYAKGTEGIAVILAALSATTVIGGGDSVAAIRGLGLADKFTHLSTGGGATLTLLECGTLPAVEALTEVK